MIGKPGPLPSAPGTLNPAFRDALRLAMRNGQPAWYLAERGGWPWAETFSNQLHAKQISLTPLTVARFAKLAAVIQFSGPLFLDPTEVRA